MGLLNLYKAMAMRPHIPYRFKAEIWPNNEGPYDEDNKNRKRIEFTIKRISQPVFNLNSDNKVYFGNTAYVVPIMKFGETTLEITFEETDDMAVFKLLAGFMGNEIYKGIYGGLINIRVTQFDETMVNIVDKKTYVCRLKEHGMPSFNNNGFGNPVELTASFNVVYIMDEPREFEDIIDGKIVIKRDEADMLPDNDVLNDQLENIALNEDIKKQQEEEKKNQALRGRRTKAMEAETKAAKERLDKKTSELTEAIQRELFRSYNASDNGRKNELLNMGKENYMEMRARQMKLNSDVLTSEQKYAINKDYQKLSNAEKLMYALDIDVSNGLDDNEIEAIRNELLVSVDSGELNQEEAKYVEDKLVNLVKEYSAARKEYDVARNKTVPINNTFVAYNGDDPLLKAVSVSYEKEVGKREGERGHIFFDMIDAGSGKGTINLGSGSSEGARGFSDVGELTAVINGVEMKFKNSASLNAAVQKAFGGKNAIVNVFEKNGGGTGDVSKEGRKKANLNGAKAGLNELLESTGGVIEDDYGNKSVVKMDKGLYLNIQLDEASSQKISDKNMTVNTMGWAESTKETIIDNVSGANKTVQGMLHMEHAYSGFRTVWETFNKDLSNTERLNNDIKQGQFSKETLAELERAVDNTKSLSAKRRADFKRVIRTYGYTS